MESFRPQRSIGSDRFLAPFSPSNSGDAVGVELNEDDLFSTGIESPEPDHPPRLQPSPPNPILNNSRSSLIFSRGRRDGFEERNFGVLAALPEEETKIHLLQRKPSISMSSSPSTSPSPSFSSARLIPAIPTPKSDFSLSVAGGKIYHQSAPVNVPVAPQRLRKVAGNTNKGERWGDEGDDGDDDEDEMLPPHEIVARASGRGSPLTTFSVLEGAGRTLKGRDLRRLGHGVNIRLANVVINTGDVGAIIQFDSVDCPAIIATNNPPHEASTYCTQQPMQWMRTIGMATTTIEVP